MTPQTAIRGVEKIHIQVNQSTIFGRNRESIVVFNRANASINKYHSDRALLGGLLLDEFIILEQAKQLVVFDMQLQNIFNLCCDDGALLSYSKFSSIPIFSFVVYKDGKVKVVDIIVRPNNQCEVMVRIEIEKLIARSILCSNGIAVLDDNVYNLEGKLAVQQPEDYRPQYICSYTREYGPRLSWEFVNKQSYPIDSKLIEIQVLSNTYCCELTKNREQKATFLTFLYSRLIGVSVEIAEGCITLYFIGTEQINVITLSLELSISNRIETVSIGMLPSELICSWFEDAGELYVVTTLGRIFGCTSLDQSYDLVISCLVVEPPALRVNMPSKRRLKFTKKKNGKGGLDFLLE